MKLLLDECLDQQFRQDLVGHDVYSVGCLGWDGTKNGRLLARAAAAGGGGLVTTDRGMEHQQNASLLPVSIYLLVGAKSNQRRDLMTFTASLLAAVANAPSNPALIRVQA